MDFDAMQGFFEAFRCTGVSASVAETCTVRLGSSNEVARAFRVWEDSYQFSARVVPEFNFRYLQFIGSRFLISSLRLEVSRRIIFNFKPLCRS